MPVTSGNFALEAGVVLCLLRREAAARRANAQALSPDGMVGGDVVVQAGGQAVVSGTIVGRIINQGGLVEVYGIVGDVIDTPDKKTTVHAGAIVQGA